VVVSCPICGSDALDSAEPLSRLLDKYWPEDGHPDYLGLKRELETEYNLGQLTVTTVKTHIDEHVTYIPSGSPDGGGPQTR
jgi:hypothetical protein